MFNEKDEEYSKKQGKNIPVWISPKYIEAKEKAVELIKSKKYDLTEGDFWILMNETKTGKMSYTGLIISHNGCLKINDKAENKIDPKGFSVYENGYKNSLVYTYVDDEIYEVGEVNNDNCKNDYPYAMALKRCFDRVVLKKCKLAYSGVYSDSEADEFSKKDDEIEEEVLIDSTKVKALRELIKEKNIDTDIVVQILDNFGYSKLSQIKMQDYMNIKNELEVN